MNNNSIERYENLRRELKIDCEKCSGLCCVALHCYKTDGFPANKNAGTPCSYLESNYSCNIHNKLIAKNYKGCVTYDCFGAGQKTTNLFAGVTWKKDENQAANIFALFLIVFQLHQMLWYLMDARVYTKDNELLVTIDTLVIEYEKLLERPIEDILQFNVEEYRNKVNHVLRHIIKEVVCINSSKQANYINYLGKNFKGANLDRQDFSMSLLIAANMEGCSLTHASFLGADLRDANVCNANLSESIFLTQMQVNAAKGNLNTKIPCHLTRPFNWKN